MGEHYSPWWALVVTAVDLLLWDLEGSSYRLGLLCSLSLPSLTPIFFLPLACQACIAEALPAGHPDM